MDHNGKKRISVCIASYNGEEFIEEQISSILEQLSNNDEVIISDDCSTDGTQEIIKGIEDDRIVFLRNKMKQGAIRNFENALRAAKGEYIFLCDQDDKWLPNKVQVCLTQLQKHALVQSDAFVVDTALVVQHKSCFELMGSRPGLIKNLVKNSYVGCCMAFNRKVLEIALPFPPHIPMHDQWIGLIGEAFFKTLFIPEKLMLYRRHLSNLSQTGSRSKFSVIEKVGFRLNILRYAFLLPYRRFLRKNI